MLPEDEQFLEWVHGYCKWYEREARRWQRALVACKWLSLLSSLLAVVVAAVISKEFFQPWGKILILGGTLLSATSSEFLAQFQVRRMEELRESGNLETAHLFAYTRDKFAELEGDRLKMFKVKDEVGERIRRLEDAQHRQFVDINAGAIASPPGAQGHTRE